MLDFFLGFAAGVGICVVVWWRVDKVSAGASPAADGQAEGEPTNGAVRAPLSLFHRSNPPDNQKALRYASAAYAREIDSFMTKGEGLGQWE